MPQGVASDADSAATLFYIHCVVCIFKMGETALAREKTEEERESERERGKEYPVPVAAARPNRAEARPRALGARAEARAAGLVDIEATRP